MIRFILKRVIKNNISGLESEYFETLDLKLPELENRLLWGGCGEQSYDHTKLIGVEILAEQKQVGDEDRTNI
jgi:hypothetical protein